MAGRTFLLDTRKFKSLNKLRAALKHNLREDGRELHSNQRIDPKRKQLNVNMVGGDNVDAIMELEKRLVAAAGEGRVKKDGGVVKVRSDAVRAIEFLFSLPPNSGVDEHKFFGMALEWVERRYQAPVLSCVRHNDEGDDHHPHMHVVVLPVRDGRMIGSSMIGLYTVMQAAFHAEVAAPFGLRSAVRPDLATRKAAAVAFMSALDARPELLHDPEVRSWMRDAVERSPARPLELVGLSMPAPRPAEKQWVATLTRPVKPAARPKAPVNSIGFDRAARQAPSAPTAKPLPVLGFVALPAFSVSGVCDPGAPPRQHLGVVIELPRLAFQGRHRGDGEYTRVPDDLPAELFDERLGDFVMSGTGQPSDDDRND